MTLALHGKSRTRRRWLIVAAIAAVILATLAGGTLRPPERAAADSTTISFDSYSDGTVNGQDGWSSLGAAGSGCALYDHAVVTNSGAPPSFGAKSLRVSNAVTSGCFGDQTFSKSLANEAGETLATNGGLSGGTRQNHFEVSWEIVSTKTTQQPGLFASFSPDRGDGGRMSYFGVADDAAGLTVTFYDVQTTAPCTPTGCANFVPTVVATNLDRTVPHSLRLAMDLLDGPNNDVVRVFIDGALSHTGTSWESYYRYDPEAAADPHTHTVDSLLIRTGGAPAPATAGFGYLIDNIQLTSSVLPAPAVTTTVVKAANLTAPAGLGWLFYNDTSDTFNNTPGVLGSFVSGPGFAPLGSGSAQIVIDGAGRTDLATFRFASTPLSSITELKFSGYNSAPASPAFLVMNVDFNLSDTWQRRLVFVPTGALADTWQEFDALQSGTAAWTYSGNTWPAPNALPGTTAKTWNQILADYPNVRVLPTGGLVGVRVGHPGPAQTVNLDKFVFATSTAKTIFDFEPTPQCTLTCYVDASTGNDLNGGTSAADAKKTIQAAINQVSVGGAVLVAAGTYPEQVAVSKSLHLIGAGAGLTTIKAPPTIPAASNQDSTVVKISGTGVSAELTGVTVSGPGPSGCGSIGFGIFVRDGAIANIHDNSIVDIRDEPFGGCQNGVGIQVGRNAYGTTGTATVSNNLITGFQKNGITVDGADSAAIIQGNTVTGAGPSNTIAQNGIQMSRGATGVVTGNTISGHNYVPADWESCGILFYQADGVRQSKNTLFDNEKNICNAGRGGGQPSISQ